MDKETLKRANELSLWINKLESSLNCFTCDFEYGDGRIDRGIDLEPKLMIEHTNTDEWEGRTITPIEISLSDDLIEIIKSHIIKERDKLQQEFNEL